MAQHRNIRDRARFVAPRAESHEVRRRRLDDRYRSARGRVLRVLAPGGYGKSTLTARWVSNDDRAVGWIDLERIDNDPVALAGTIERVVADLMGGRADDRPSGSSAGRAVGGLASSVGSLVENCERPFVLVLDDVHHVDDRASLELLTELAEHLPEESTLVLCGRAHRPLDQIGRLRVHPGVVDVTTADLAFTTDEGTELLAELGITLDGAQAGRLVERLEGWPAGLRLAGRVLLDGRDPASLTIERIGENVALVDYLRGEWADNLRPDDLELLRGLACLGRFTGAMCDEVLGLGGSGERLQRLHRDRLLLMPLDVREEWYRMHPVLARWLEGELCDLDRQRWCKVHLAAADYWEREGDIDLAIQHAATAAEFDRCEQLVMAHSGRYFTRGMYATVERWLRTFPADRRASSVTLALVASTSALYHDPAAATHWARHLRRLADGDDPVAAAAAETWADLLGATLELRAVADSIPAAQRARRDVPPGPWQAFSSFVLGGLQLVAADDAAIDTLDEGAFEAELAGAWLQRANCLAMAAVGLDWAGATEEATSRVRQARQILAANDIEWITTTATVFAMSALVEARHGQWAVARAELEAARAHLALYPAVGPWFNVVSRIPLVGAALRVDEPVLARTLLGELDHHLRFEPSDAPMRRRVAALRAQVDSAPHWLDPVETLTAAELRVLRYLPTDLSLAAVAQRLYVSRNTVKSQTAAIYRKLGVSSRREAVERARNAGLIGDRLPD